MANWNLPTVTSGYLDFVAEMNSKFVDAGTIGFGSPTNLPEHAFRYNRSVNIFEEWVASAWEAKVIGLTGGGTGGNTAASARTNLGIGSMGTQNSNAVNITGGSITGVTLSGSDITTGIIPLSRGGTGSSLSAAPVGYVIVSDGNTTFFSSGTHIPQLNAYNLAVGIVPDARLSANVALRNVENSFAARQTFNGDVLFQGSSYPWACTIMRQTDVPVFNMYSGIAGPGRKWTRITTSNGDTHLQSLDDAYNNPSSLLIVTYAGVILGNGSGLHTLNASNLAYGTIQLGVLGTNPGSASSATFLRGDNSWQPVVTGGEVSPIPSGLIAMFSTGCPAGWTRVSGLDDRFPRGSTSYGSTGGRWTHAHGVGGQTGAAGGHSHSFSGSGSGSGSGRTGELDSAMNFQPGPNLGAGWSHTHPFSVNVNVNVEGNTGGVGDHAHAFSVGTSEEDHTLPYMTVVFCQKN